MRSEEEIRERIRDIEGVKFSQTIKRKEEEGIRRNRRIAVNMLYWVLDEDESTRNE